MKKSGLIAAVVVGLLSFVVLRDRKPEQPVLRPPAPPSVDVVAKSEPDKQSVAPPVVEESVAVPAPGVYPEGPRPSAQSLEQPSPVLEPDQALEVLRVTVRNYGQRFKGNPIGNNAEITAALNGGNPQGVHFLDPARDHINDRGELIDSWGTPYFFHQLSALDMEIHSAGPDRVMWTADDRVAK